MTTTTRPLRIGNVSASRGDRASATGEFLAAASLDVLALDMLSDEAMLERAAVRADGGPGYEPALLDQVVPCLDRIGRDGVRIVTNAGALDPEGLAAELRERAGAAGVELAVASVDAGDVTARSDEFGLGDVDVATVRHGAFGIAAALSAGAHVVVTGRVSREALVTGAAAAHHGWTPSALDALAGSVAVGHVLSGGPGATGVVASSTDVTRTTDPVTGGYPIAEIAADGSAVITRHPSAYGSVTVGTVTDQLLDGVAGARYAAPDVVLRLDSVRLVQEGTDRVRLSGARGEPAPPVVAVVAMTAGEAGGSRLARPLAQDRAAMRCSCPTAPGGTSRSRRRPRTSGPASCRARGSPGPSPGVPRSRRRWARSRACAAASSAAASTSPCGRGTTRRSRGSRGTSPRNGSPTSCPGWSEWSCAATCCPTSARSTSSPARPVGRPSPRGSGRSSPPRGC